MIKDFRIYRRPGWRLNPDDEKINKLIVKLLESGGVCPTTVHNRIGHNQCPCSAYLQMDTCYCGLYVKENSNESSNKNNSEHKPIQNFSSYGGC